MRIIDKLYDYYDYLQDHNDTLVFDRRNSYVVSARRYWLYRTPWKQWAYVAEKEKVVHKPSRFA